MNFFFKVFFKKKWNSDQGLPWSHIQVYFTFFLIYESHEKSPLWDILKILQQRISKGIAKAYLTSSHILHPSKSRPLILRSFVSI
jgi:hypothetical protein